MLFWALTDGDEVDVFGVAGGRGEMHLVQDGATAHSNFLREKAIAEDRSHHQAEEQILLDLVERGPGDFPLMSEHILAGEHDHA